MAVESTLLQQDLVYAGLDALLTAFPLDLCAYLHAGAETGPQLYMRQPDLAAMDPGVAFDLFTALRHTLEASRDEDALLTIDGYGALAVTTRGTSSSGLHVVGRRGAVLTSDEQRLASALCRSLGAACHALDAAARTPAAAPASSTPAVTLGRITVAIGNGEPDVEVTLDAHGETRTGRSSSPSPAVAVVGAVGDALGRSLHLTRSGDARVGDDTLLVLEVADDTGASAFGVAALGEDPLHASALAALDAAGRLGTSSARNEAAPARSLFGSRRRASA